MSTVPFGLAVSMVKSTLQRPVKFEGSTTFSLTPTHTYHYGISLGDGKLRIALEGCDSKKKWCTKELGLEDFVNASNSIPDARAADYAECFHELLSTSLDGASKPPRALRKVKDAHLLLEFYVKVKALLKSRVVTYTFNLEPISVERIDVLESKVLDLQQEVKLLRAEAARRNSAHEEMQKMISDLRIEVKTLCGSVKAPSVFLARSTSQLGPEGLVLWRCEDLKVLDGVFHDLHPGIYQVNVTVHLTSGDGIMQLNKGKYVVCSGSGSPQVSLSSVIHVHKGDQVSVYVNGSMSSGYMTFALLAKLTV